MFSLSPRTHMFVSASMYIITPCCQGVHLCLTISCTSVLNGFVCTAVPRTSQWALCCLADSSSPTPLSSSKLRLRLYVKFSGLMVTSCGASEGLRGSSWVNTLLPCSLHAPDSSCSSWFSTWRCSRTYSTNTAVFTCSQQQQWISFVIVAMSWANWLKTDRLKLYSCIFNF